MPRKSTARTRPPKNVASKAHGPVRDDEWLTIDEVCAIAKISRRTFERYRTLGRGPRVKRLAGNGPIRIRRDWFDAWMGVDA